jgi:hypothetical protein
MTWIFPGRILTAFFSDILPCHLTDKTLSFGLPDLSVIEPLGLAICFESGPSGYQMGSLIRCAGLALLLRYAALHR